MIEERLMAPVSAGELIDKITILELKAKHISDSTKLANVNRELGELSDLWSKQPGIEKTLGSVEGLRKVNAALWDVEDQLRAYEDSGEFGSVFVESARSVYKLNDHRAALKYEINQATGSRLVEEKAYQ